MTRITRLSINLILISFFLVTTLIIYTENSSSIIHKVTENIKNDINRSLNVTTEIESLEIKWVGLSPRIYIKNIFMSDDNQRILLDIPTSEIHLSLINSLKNNSLSLGKIIINDTKLNLNYNRNKLLFNEKNLVETSNSETKILFPEVMLNNSHILLTNIENNKSMSFKTKSLFASYDGNRIRINSNFIHESSPNPMTFIYEGKNLDSSLNSKIFISGNLVKIPYPMLPEPMSRLQSKEMSFRIWMDLIDADITRVSGNISTNKLIVNLGNSELYLKNVNSDLIYLKENQSETLGLLRMNYLINNK